MPVPLDLSGPERQLRDLARALRSEENGRELRRDLTRNLRSAAQPARQAARAAIRSAPSSRRRGRSIRAAIAGRIAVEAKPSGRAVGVRIVARRVKLRGFVNAPKHFNEGFWFHPVFGGDTWLVGQVGKRGWFDDSVRKERRGYRRAVVKAMNDTAKRVARKV